MQEEGEEVSVSSKDRIGSDQFFNLITGEELSWQSIIYDLIKTEQLDPWDIDIGILAEKYAETISLLEEADFFISSKVLLACSLLLRLKSELLINRYIQGLNQALYGREVEKRELERIEIDENELPILVPRTPMPRYKKVTLKELMNSLNQAIETENRRIKKEIKKKQAQKSAEIVLPKITSIPLKERIKTVFISIKQHLSKPDQVHMKYSDLAPTREEKLSAFLPILQLTNNERIYTHQPKHFDEIYIALQMMQEEIEILKNDLGLINEATEEELKQLEMQEETQEQ